MRVDIARVRNANGLPMTGVSSTMGTARFSRTGCCSITRRADPRLPAITVEVTPPLADSLIRRQVGAVRIPRLLPEA